MQGVGESYPDAEGNNVSYEVIPQHEKQRVTDLARKALGLQAAKTGLPYGGEVPANLSGIATSLRPAGDNNANETTTPKTTQ